MSGVVAFYWCDSEGDPHFVRIPRDEVRAIRYDGQSHIEIQLTNTYQDVNIFVGSLHSMEEDIRLKFATKMINSIRSTIDEDVSWEFDGIAWTKTKSKGESVWSRQ